MVGGDYHSFPRRLRAFREDTRGAIGAFTVVVFGTMVVALGMAIDFMRHETLRSELQFAVDRGALAAATLGNTQNAEDVVRGYLLSTSFVPKDGNQELDADIKINVEKTGGTHNPRVEATASYEMRTFFLSMVGIPSIDVNVLSVARQGVKDVEMAFVVDISDSVASDEESFDPYRTADAADGDEDTPTPQQQISYDFEGFSPTDLGWVIDSPKRIEVIREVAKAFVADIYADPMSNRLSIGLVPFSGSVNPGQTVFDLMLTDEPTDGYTQHDYSTCLEFEYDDYRTTTLPISRKLDQLQQVHSTVWKDSRNETSLKQNPNWGLCPIEQNQIVYPTNDLDKLTDALDGLEANDGTGTHIGMKWGVGLLDPNSRDLFTTLIGKNEIPGEMAGRPYNYNSVESEKVIVLMTDGLTMYDQRPFAEFYRELDHIERFATPGDENIMAFRWDHDDDALTDPVQVAQKVRDRDFNETPLPLSTRADFRRICEAAKDAGIRIFTLGFNLGDLPLAQEVAATADLAECASPVSDSNPTGTKHAYSTSSLAELVRALKTIRVEIAAIHRDQR